MATTKFKGPVNSLKGFQFNGVADTIAGTFITLPIAGSKTYDAGIAGLTTVRMGWGQEVSQTSLPSGGQAGGSKCIIAVQPYASSASFVVRGYFSGTASGRSMSGLCDGTSTVHVILIGSV